MRVKQSFRGKSAVLLSTLAFLATAAPWQGASAYTHKILYSFCAAADCTDGVSPSGALVMDGSGNLFGTTSNGGAVGTNGRQEGVVFELTPNAQHTRWRYKVIHNFCQKSGCSDGEEPQAPLILDQSGNLYGTTPYGGDNDGGTVFKLLPSGRKWKYSVLHRFCRKSTCADGEGPFQGLTYAGQTSGLPYDGMSPLFGTTGFGGKYNGISDGGTVFSLTPDQATGVWQEKVLYSFCSAVSCSPRLPIPSSSVTIGADGTLYGTLDDDGFTGNVYALSPKVSGGWKEKTDYTFCALASCADGENPETDNLAIDDAGNLYGTTLGGGAHSRGTIFELNPATGQLTTLYNFCTLASCADGSGSLSNVVRNASGDLFGVTSQGGNDSGGGIAYMLHNGTFQVLYSFCAEANCADGVDPETGLIMDSGGVLYGVSGGGANSGGTVYALVP